jgi:hypothetical protein
MKDFDFGFTAVTEEELDVVQAGAQSEEKLQKLYKTILPLLENLKANPEKDYIFWPNRVKKVEEFENIIKEIVK